MRNLANFAAKLSQLEYFDLQMRIFHEICGDTRSQISSPPHKSEIKADRLLFVKQNDPFLHLRSYVGV